MTTPLEELRSGKCKPCEGGVPPCTAEEVERYLHSLTNWRVTPDGQRIRREWTTRNFLAAIRFFQLVADLAESEGHHPDLHLTGYRRVAIEIWTHAIGGLSDNDFILASKIDEIPIELSKK